FSRAKLDHFWRAPKSRRHRPSDARRRPRVTISLGPLFLRRRIPLARAIPSIFLGGQFCPGARRSREATPVSLELNRSLQQQQRTRAQLGSEKGFEGRPRRLRSPKLTTLRRTPKPCSA